MRWVMLAGLSFALSFACEKAPSPVAEQSPEARTQDVPELSPRSSRPAAERVVAIGDVHGDLDAAKKALRAAGAIDEHDAWIGQKLVVVQTGDEIDRGPDDRAVIDLFERLKGEASRAGGELIALVGNHEIMNATFDFRYVAPDAWAAFDGITPTGPEASHAARFGDVKRGRASAFAPGGPYALVLSERPAIVRVGDTVFVHGGVHRKHATYGIDRINDGIRDWLAGRAPAPPAIAVADDGPLWTRAFSDGNPSADLCRTLGETLTKLRATRLVMGHTIQESGITSACDGKAWRIDVGMAHVLGGPVQVLEIRGGTATVVKPN